MSKQPHVVNKNRRPLALTVSGIVLLITFVIASLIFGEPTVF